MDKLGPINKTLKLSLRRAKTTKRPKKQREIEGVESDKVDLSAKASSLKESKKSEQSSHIRADLVKKFKDEIMNGKYQVKTNEIAEKIIQKLKEETYYKHPS